MKNFAKSLILIILVLLIGCTPSTEETPQESEPAAINTEAPASPTDEPEPTEEEVAPPTDDEGFPDPAQGIIPVIYSHGGAPCDIVATVYLDRHPNVDLIGTVLSRGEIHPEAALEKWIVFLYDVLNSQHTALALGSNEKMDPNWHDFPEHWRVAADTFWGLALPSPVSEYEVGSGPELIVELVNNSPTKVTIVGMASMIDIVRAIQIDPGIIDNIAHVVIMGGAFTVPGNLSDDQTMITDNTVAEWNIWIDAEAARYLFNSGVRLSIVPLDAIQYLVQPADVDQMNTIANTVNDPGVSYVSQMWNDLRGLSDEGFLIWDTITIVAITNPEFFYWVYDGVDVVTEPGPNHGQTIALNNNATHTRYATGADYDAIMAQIFETMQGEAQTTSGEPSWVTIEGTTITGLGGTWEGDTPAFHIIFNLDEMCELDVVCGTFDIPDFTLTGDVTFTAIEGDRLQFRTTNLSNGMDTDDLYEYFQILENGSVRYVSIGPENTSEAILTRR